MALNLSRIFGRGPREAAQPQVAPDSIDGGADTNEANAVEYGLITAIRPEVAAAGINNGFDQEGTSASFNPKEISVDRLQSENGGLSTDPESPEFAGAAAVSLPEVGDEVVLNLNNKNPELTRFHSGQGMDRDELERQVAAGDVNGDGQESFTGSDEELGALIAWLQSNRLIDTSTGEIVWADEATAAASFESVTRPFADGVRANNLALSGDVDPSSATPAESFSLNFEEIKERLQMGPNGILIWNGEPVSHGLISGNLGAGPLAAQDVFVTESGAPGTEPAGILPYLEQQPLADLDQAQGTETARLAGDATGDGIVDAADYVLARANPVSVFGVGGGVDDERVADRLGNFEIQDVVAPTDTNQAQDVFVTELVSPRDPATGQAEQLSGDFDGDGDVSGADFLVSRTSQVSVFGVGGGVDLRSEGTEIELGASSEAMQDVFVTELVSPRDPASGQGTGINQQTPADWNERRAAGSETHREPDESGNLEFRRGLLEDENADGDLADRGEAAKWELSELDASKNELVDTFPQAATGTQVTESIDFPSYAVDGDDDGPTTLLGDLNAALADDAGLSAVAGLHGDGAQDWFGAHHADSDGDSLRDLEIDI